MDSFISWIGGKKLLKKQIIQEFPQEYDRYVEMFGGAGWVLFSEERPKILEVYNDINGDLVNLYRCVKCHPEAIQKELQGLLMSRELFFDAKDIIFHQCGIENHCEQIVGNSCAAVAVYDVREGNGKLAGGHHFLTVSNFCIDDAFTYIHDFNFLMHMRNEIHVYKKSFIIIITFFIKERHKKSLPCNIWEYYVLI